MLILELTTDGDDVLEEMLYAVEAEVRRHLPLQRLRYPVGLLFCRRELVVGLHEASVGIAEVACRLCGHIVGDPVLTSLGRYLRNGSVKAYAGEEGIGKTLRGLRIPVALHLVHELSYACAQLSESQLHPVDLLDVVGVDDARPRRAQRGERIVNLRDGDLQLLDIVIASLEPEVFVVLREHSHRALDVVYLFQDFVELFGDVVPDAHLKPEFIFTCHNNS